MTRLCILLSVILFSVYQTEQAYFLEDEYINQINAQASTWKAGRNFDPKTTRESLVKLLGSKGVEGAKKAKSSEFKTHDKIYGRKSKKIPSKFDARKKWKNCKTIGMVPDQGNCGSCWAVSTSTAFADRMCIATDGEFNQQLSVEQLTFCCSKCGWGCEGGFPIDAWYYFSYEGLVTGGDYDSGEGCQPYRVPPCPNDEYGVNSCIGQPTEKNHRCRGICYGDEDIDYDNDIRYTRDYYYLTYGTIQQDIMTYGPIEASFEVYDDFFSYKSGVYVKSENASLLGGHAVKLIGWGEEFGVPYWLMVNSWGDEWGENGLFKIRRGTNECEIDNSTTAGVPVTY